MGVLRALTVVLTLLGVTTARADDLGRPLGFEPNVGQAPEPVAFVARGQGYLVRISPDDVTLALRAPSQTSHPRREAVVRNATTSRLGLTLRLVDARPGALSPLDPLPGRASYFVGTDPGRWRTDVPTWGRVLRS